MNWIGFIRLIKNIYGRKLPDLDAIQRQGLLAVKIGQVFALRIDFLNEATCRHLARLYRSAVSLPPEQMERLLDLYTDSHFRQRFDYIDTTPLASASVGQVHRARLKNGKEVVIKLVKHDARQQFTRDVRSVKSLFRFCIFFYPKLAKVADPVGVLENIEDYTLTELNLLNEIKGQDVLRTIHNDNRTGYDLSSLRFADFHRELCSEQVLVADFVEGKTFDELLERGELSYQQLLELFHIHGFFMFVIGTFHGDIHPGNIILNDGKICFVDTSAISRTGPKIRKGLFEFFGALSWYDYEKCAYFLNKMSEVEIEGKRFDAFQKKFIDLYADFTDSTVAQVSLTKKMMDTIRLGIDSGMVFERGMFPIIKSLMYLDGMVLSCKPDAVLMKDMRVFIDETRAAVRAS
ncbi:MAG: AarF/ABC1/UbiB kinase family protein [Proteobacteria bacterium]|nr:AarF/ABC1/UbiB kinase family protein [Pseudomonadota bacterium]